MRSSYAPDGRRLVTWGGGFARLWSDTFELVGAPLPHDKYRCVPTFLESRVALCNRDKVYFINRDTGEQMAPVIEHAGLRGAKLSPDLRYVVTFSDDGTIKMWRTQDGRSVCATLFHSGAGLYAQFDPTSRWLITFSNREATVRVWDVPSGEPKSEMLRFPETIYHDMRFGFFEGEIFIVGQSMRRELRVWTVSESGANQVPIDLALSDQILALIEYRLLVFGSRPQRLRSFDVRDGSLIAEQTLPRRHSRRTSLSRDGRYVVLGFDDEHLVLRTEDLEPAGPAFRAELPSGASRLNSDNSVVLATYDGLRARLRSRELGLPLAPSLMHRDVADDLPRLRTLLSGDQCSLATWTSSGDARLWRITDSFPRQHELRHPGGVSRLAVEEALSVGRVISLQEQTVRLWSVEGSPYEIEGPLSEEKVNGLARSPDSSLFSTWNENALRIWSSRSGRPVTDAMAHRGIKGATFSDDQRFVVSWSDDLVRLWAVETGHEVTRQYGTTGPSSLGSRCCRRLDGVSAVVPRVSPYEAAPEPHSGGAGHESA